MRVRTWRLLICCTIVWCCVVVAVGCLIFILFHLRSWFMLLLVCLSTVLFNLNYFSRIVFASSRFQAQLRPFWLIIFYKFNTCLNNSQSTKDFPNHDRLLKNHLDGCASVRTGFWYYFIFIGCNMTFHIRSQCKTQIIRQKKQKTYWLL